MWFVWPIGTYCYYLKLPYLSNWPKLDFLLFWMAPIVAIQIAKSMAWTIQFDEVVALPLRLCFYGYFRSDLDYLAKKGAIWNEFALISFFSNCRTLFGIPRSTLHCKLFCDSADYSITYHQTSKSRYILSKQP